jgi:hypothetical protein
MLRRPQALLLLLPLLAFTACDVTGPDVNTRVLLSRAGSGTSSALIPTSIAASHGSDREDDRRRNPTAVLALVEDLEVTVTAVQALPAQYLDRRDQEGLWETMTLSGPATVNLLNLPAESGEGLTMFEGNFEPGAYVRLRFLVSEIELTLAAPLTLEGHTFPAGEPIEVLLQDPWVRIPGAFFTVTEGETATVDVFFDSAATIGQLVVTPSGNLRFAPVMLGKQWRQDRD